MSALSLHVTSSNGYSWKEDVIGNPGIYQWTPTVKKTKKNCRVKLVLKDAAGKNIGTDTSDGVYTITP